MMPQNKNNHLIYNRLNMMRFLERIISTAESHNRPGGLNQTAECANRTAACVCLELQ